MISESMTSENMTSSKSMTSENKASLESMTSENKASLESMTSLESVTSSEYKNRKKDFLWYWFCNIKGIGSLSRRKLLEVFGHPETIYQTDLSQLAPYLKANQLKAFSWSRNPERVYRELDELAREGIFFVHPDSPVYPERLRQVPDPPLSLYVKGRLPDPSRPAIAMIGSRHCTVYGKRIAAELAAALAARGVQIISGLAEGIDGASHRGALRAHGYTLGILGGGIDTIYPRDHFNLYWQMYQEGGVVSEWNRGTPNHPGLFPMRNRLISAFSDGVFVVEAAAKSGTFITVDMALEQGRPVFALPGRITDVNSAGTNQLISEGAIPVMSEETIPQYLEMEGLLPPAGRLSQEKEKKDDSRGESDKASTESLRREESMTQDQRFLYDLLDEQVPTEFSALCTKSGFSIGRCSHALFELEKAGLIIQPRQNIYLLYKSVSGRRAGPGTV